MDNSLTNNATSSMQAQDTQLTQALQQNQQFANDMNTARDIIQADAVH